MSRGALAYNVSMLRYVDHVIFGVDNLDAAAGDYAEKLRFAVSPGGTHPGAGTYNRLIVLDPEYVELIARLPGATPGALNPVAPMFSRAPGPLGFALASDDVEADVAAMRGRGVPVGDPREGRLEGTHGAQRGWRVARIDEDAALGIDSWRLPFIIQHDSAGHERLRRLAAPDKLAPHPSGARTLDHVTVAVRDLDAGLRAFALGYGLEPGDAETSVDDMLGARTACLPLPQGAIVLAAPLTNGAPLARSLQAHGEGLFSVAIAVDDLQQTVDTLRGLGIGVRVEEPDGVLVAARPAMASAHGARLEFVQRHAAGR